MSSQHDHDEEDEAKKAAAEAGERRGDPQRAEALDEDALEQERLQLAEDAHATD